MENQALQEYKVYQQQHGHPNLKVDKSGLCISVSNPWLAGSPDGLVSDPRGDDTSEHLGLAEIKNPFSSRSQTLIEATKKSTFCLEKDDDTTTGFRLKPRHDYHYQVQTLLYCTNRHFVVRRDICATYTPGSIMGCCQSSKTVQILYFLLCYQSWHVLVTTREE